MKTKLLGLLTVAVALAAFAFIVPACGGGGGGYFQELEDLAITFDEDGSALDPQFQAIADAETDEEAIELTREVLPATASIVADFVEGLRGLDPSAEAQDAHDAAVSAGEDVVDALDAIADQAAGIETAADAIALLEEFSLATTEFEAFSAACEDLQAIADDSGADVDLRCG